MCQNLSHFQICKTKAYTRCRTKTLRDHCKALAMYGEAMKVEQRKQILYAAVKENESKIKKRVIRQYSKLCLGATRKRLQVSKAYHC